MRLIITGSRTVTPTFEEIDHVVQHLVAEQFGDKLSGPLSSRIIEVISGAAKGSDAAGEEWARARGIPVHQEPVTKDDYDKYGQYIAPRMRNRRMAERASHAAIFWDGISAGSADMATRMCARGKPVAVVPTAKRSRARPENITPSKS